MVDSVDICCQPIHLGRGENFPFCKKRSRCAGQLMDQMVLQVTDRWWKIPFRHRAALRTTLRCTYCTEQSVLALQYSVRNMYNMSYHFSSAGCVDSTGKKAPTARNPRKFAFIICRRIFNKYYSLFSFSVIYIYIVLQIHRSGLDFHSFTVSLPFRLVKVKVWTAKRAELSTLNENQRRGIFTSLLKGTTPHKKKRFLLGIAQISKKVPWK